MANISLTLYTNGIFGSVLKSPTQMGSLSINNSVTNISRLGTFNLMENACKSLYNMHSKRCVYEEPKVEIKKTDLDEEKIKVFCPV
jgi:hypothetical protein